MAMRLLVLASLLVAGCAVEQTSDPPSVTVEVKAPPTESIVQSVSTQAELPPPATEKELEDLEPAPQVLWLTCYVPVPGLIPADVLASYRSRLKAPVDPGLSSGPRCPVDIEPPELKRLHDKIVEVTGGAEVWKRPAALEFDVEKEAFLFRQRDCLVFTVRRAIERLRRDNAPLSPPP